MRALCILLVACAPAAAAPAAKPIKVTGELAIVAELPAWAFATVGDKLAVIDDGFTTATAVDTITGAQVWHVTLEKTASGRHTLHALPAAFGAWTGPLLHLIDPASGAIHDAPHAPYHGTEWRDGGCGLDSDGGMCAWRCQCGYQVFDCASGAALGKHYEHTYMEMFPQDGPPSSGCWGLGSYTLGRVGGRLLFSGEDSPQGGHSYITAALDAKTGAEAWRIKLAATSDPTHSGVSPNQATCWFSSSENAVAVVDCASGKPLWQLPADTQYGAYFMLAFVPQAGLYELRGRRATLYDERTGKPRWRVELAANTIGWPRGIAPALDWRYQDATAVALLDPATGKQVGTVPHAKASAIVPTTTGALIAGDDIRAFDATGKLIATAPIAKAGILLGTDRLLAVTETQTIVLALPDLHEVGRIPGTYSEHHLIGPRRGVLFQYDGKTVGRLIIVKLGS